jgi:hypothetical protein
MCSKFVRVHVCASRCACVRSCGGTAGCGSCGVCCTHTCSSPSSSDSVDFR